ncbi:hypothetical protein [Actinoplanes sp. NPDC049802]|uniref:hypothetical protein n=1 Tax=Actinoplanes sp. NPDC049802 TaxID=3154742 RepID=UPI0033D3FACF
MTAHSLIIAVAVGVVTGVAGRLFARRRRLVPVWLPISAGVAAAVLATVLTWLADAILSGLSDAAVVLQVLFAAAAVAIVVLTADRPAPVPLETPTRGSLGSTGKGQLQ